MIDRKFINKKIENIEKYLDETEEIFKFSLEEIKKDFFKYRSAERVLQLIVDEMLDINNHLIRRLTLKVPDEFQGTFLVLAEVNILPSDFAQKLAPVVGLRNRLVHRYEEINLDLFLSTFQKEKGDFRKYLKFIQEYLEKI